MNDKCMVLQDAPHLFLPPYTYGVAHHHRWREIKALKLLVFLSLYCLYSPLLFVFVTSSSQLVIGINVEVLGVSGVVVVNEVTGNMGLCVCTLIVKLRDNMGLVVFNEKDGSLGYDR